MNPEEQNNDCSPIDFEEDASQSTSDREFNKDELVDAVSSDVGTEEENNLSDESPELLFDEILSERDEYLSLLQSVKAEFSNYQKQTKKRITETRTSARGEIVEKILPVLDACDAAISHGAEDVAAIRKALIDSLENEGLELVGRALEEFDPSIHEAISHEPGIEDEEGQVVSEVLRQGYFWEGKILRPAMVKVRG
ncbi:MAG: nucleotide exchange factor GrpE [Actinomycetota bacterium]|nr:nucleotide exchange factor GrpE [Actinomycetota bacterium]|tara:strand:- start:358 stop:945 length:588 start_codon:yes stop_codon:yes gene_type:complete